MAPVVIADGEDIPAKIAKIVADNKVVIFSKSYCPFCMRVKSIFGAKKNADPVYVELDEMPGDLGRRVQSALEEKTGIPTVPNVFVNGKNIGTFNDTAKADGDGVLDAMMAAETHSYDYDLVIIGGGSGGLAASKEAARLGKKVAVFDFVTPSPPGTTWGLGGTCVNVGCIPKKLMHQAALLGGFKEDAPKFGWEGDGDGGENKPHKAMNWELLVESVQNHIRSLNWTYRVTLRDKGVKYHNELARFTGPNTIKAVNKKGKESIYTAEKFIVATGGRPRYPNIPGALEYGITSDDIFSLGRRPGKTLCVGASYISLECAGFLHGFGFDTTVMVRSILLRGFDQQMANKIGDYMEEEGINLIRECVPTKLEKLDDGKIKVFAKYKDGTEYSDVFDTVMFAVGRDAETSKLDLNVVGVEMNPKNGKIIHDDCEKSSVDYIYAIGDVLDGKQELTPVAIQAGIRLARRLCGVSEQKTDYVNVATTVFTPLEYGAIGMAEEDARVTYGDDDIEVFHKNFWPLEWTLPKRSEKHCYAKLVVRKSDGKVVGFHYLGPNAGEVTQGYGGMILMGATKADFDNLIGIHPTNAELFTTMEITKSSGVDPSASGC